MPWPHLQRGLEESGWMREPLSTRQRKWRTQQLTSPQVRDDYPLRAARAPKSPMAIVCREAAPFSWMALHHVHPEIEHASRRGCLPCGPSGQNHPAKASFACEHGHSHHVMLQLPRNCALRWGKTLPLEMLARRCWQDD